FFAQNNLFFRITDDSKRPKPMEQHVPYNPDGRPKLDPEEKRSEKLQTHLTPSEAELIKLKCSMADMSVSQFLRDLALDKAATSACNRAELKTIPAASARTGTNINQTVKVVKSGTKSEDDRSETVSHWLVPAPDEL